MKVNLAVPNVTPNSSAGRSAERKVPILRGRDFKLLQPQKGKCQQDSELNVRRQSDFAAGAQFAGRYCKKVTPALRPRGEPTS